MFQPVTSLDDFIVRVKAVYPNWTEGLLDLIREMYKEKRFESLYWDRLSDTVSDWRMEVQFDDNDVLAVIDQAGNIIPNKFAELIAVAKMRVADQALKPQRQQLADDFHKTFLGDIHHER